MIYPLVLELADDGVPVAVACRVLGFSKQAFYRWRASPVSKRDWDDAHLTNAAIDAHRDDPTFGYRFIADDLVAAGHRASERRVWRLCSQQRLWSLHSKKRGLTRKAGPPVHDDRVRRAFTAPDLDKLWLTDITEHPTGEGKLYLCAIKDACSRRSAIACGPRLPSRPCKWQCTAGTRPGRSSTRIAAASSGRRSSSARSATPGSSDRWAESARAPTTLQWNRSSPSCKRTS